MSVVVVAGAVFGIGLLMIGFGLRGVPLPVTSSATVSGTVENSTREASGRPSFKARVGVSALRAAEALRLDPGRWLGADLAVVGRSAEDHAARSILVGVWFAAMVVLLTEAASTGGVAVPRAVVAVGALLAAVAGPVIATAVLKAEATGRRNEFLVDLGAYSDLVVLLLAAGSGIEGALTGAADAGEDWTWCHLRDTLRRARLTRQTPADALVGLGRRLRIVELEELGAAVALTSSSGSRLRESLAARSDALRARELARVQAQAASATERMTFPVVALAIGFLFVLGFPGLARVLAGF